MGNRIIKWCRLIFNTCQCLHFYPLFSPKSTTLMSWFCFMILSLMYSTGTMSIYHFTTYFCLSVWLNSIYHFTTYFYLSVWFNIMTLFLSFSPCHHHFRSHMFYLDDLTQWNECAYSSPKQVLPPRPQHVCFCCLWF